MRRRYLYLGLVVVFVIVKFYPLWLLGRVPIPFDILAGGYWPWRLVDYGYPAGVPIKNPIVSDVVSQLFIWNDLFWDLSKKGLAPFWDGYSLLGYPYYANYHSAVFFPLNILGLLMDSVTARTWVLILMQLIAIYGMFGYMSYKKTSPIGALMASVVFVSAGLMNTDFLYSSGGRAISFLPYVFWMTEAYLDKKKLVYLRLLAVSWVMLILSGHFQVSAYAVLVWIGYLVSRHTSTGLKVRAVVWLLLGVGMAAVQLVPSLELIARSFRGSEEYVAQVNNGILPLKHLITTFWAPDFFGNNSTGNYFGFWNYREAIGYLGLIPGYLALLAVMSRPRGFWSIVFLVSLGMVFVPFVGGVVYSLNLPLLSGSAASRWLFITGFSASVLAAQGFEMVERRVSWRWFIMYGAGLVGVLVWIGVERWVYVNAGMDLSREGYFLRNTTSIRNMILPSVNMLILSAVLACFSFFSQVRLRKVLGLMLVVAICADFLRFHFKFNVFADPGLRITNTRLTESLDRDRRVGSVSDELLPPNTATLLRLPSAMGYDPLYPLDNGVYLNTINGGKNPQAVGRYFNQISDTTSNLLDYAGVTYLTTLTRDEKGVLSSTGKIPYFIDSNKWQEYGRDREMMVLQNKQALPMVYLARQIHSLDRDKHLGEMVGKGNLKTYVDGQVGGTQSGTIKYKIFENGEVNVWSKTEDRGFLVYNQAWYPGWQATIDGKPAKIMRTNYLFQGVEVPGGEHLVAWRFVPKSFYTGLVFSVFCFLVVSLYRDEQQTRGVSKTSQRKS